MDDHPDDDYDDDDDDRHIDFEKKSQLHMNITL